MSILFQEAKSRKDQSYTLSEQMAASIRASGENESPDAQSSRLLCKLPNENRTPFDL